VNNTSAAAILKLRCNINSSNPNHWSLFPDMFKTTHDAANRDVVRAVIRAELNLVGLALRAERKVMDKIVDG
jgi:hypothetical protein